MPLGEILDKLCRHDRSMKQYHYYLDGCTIKVGFLFQFRVGFINIVRIHTGGGTLGIILEISLFVRGHVFSPFVSLRFWVKRWYKVIRMRVSRKCRQLFSTLVSHVKSV